ncbi:MAG: polymer-forming cytoskeletal protein [Halomonas sp.]|nr:polymer-forming cytoskeletal protein [Halomonas sp.]
MFSKTKPTNTPSSMTDTQQKMPHSEEKVSLHTTSRQSTSVIGSNTQVHGDINSDEDMTIEGQITGIVICKQHTVTLGKNGSLSGDAYAHTLRVSGSVDGNLTALHKITVHDGAHVTGTLTTPCLVLEDGSVFHGSIDMNPDNDVFTSVFSSQPTKDIYSKDKNASSTQYNQQTANLSADSVTNDDEGDVL